MAADRRPSLEPEDRVRLAAEELVSAIVALVAEASAPAPARPVELLGLDAAADRLGIGRSSLFRSIAAGELRTVKVRGRRLVPSTELERIARGEPAPPPAPARRRRSLGRPRGEAA